MSVTQQGDNLWAGEVPSLGYAAYGYYTTQQGYRIGPFWFVEQGPASDSEAQDATAYIAILLAAAQEREAALRGENERLQGALDALMSGEVSPPRPLTKAEERACREAAADAVALEPGS